MNKKNIAVIILTLIAAAIIIGLWVSNTIAITDALIYLAVLLWEKILGLDKRAGIFTRVYTLVLIIMAWVIFRADNLPAGVEYIGSMLGVWGNCFWDDVFITQLSGCYIILLIAVTGSVALINNFFTRLSRTPYVWVRDVCLLVVFVFSLVKIVSGSYSPFIYFNF